MNTLLTVVHAMKEVVNSKYGEASEADERYSCSTALN